MNHDGSERGEWAPPESFDDFRVVRPLGRGGMGTVYLGHDEMLDRAVALKFIAAADPDRKARERFLREARAIARLHHPNVVGIYRIGEVGGNPYVAYELVPGEGLHALRRPVAWRQVVDLAVGVARGLAAAHRRGILHRDIKPANIMVAEDGSAKLLDFGLAKLAGEHEATDDAPDRAPRTDGLTSIGKLAGTPAYMAPELWRGEPATVRSDLFAFGLVLYELLAGALPFGSATDVGIDYLSREVPRLAALRPDLPRTLTELVDRCTRRDPRERFETADELRDLLERVAAVYQSFVDEKPAEVDETALVADSLARVAATPEPFASRFYERLFTTRPDTRALFPTEMSDQRRKLVNALHMVVRGLRAPETIVPLLEELGERHAGYGIQSAHFEAVGDALLGTFRELDASWNGDAERAWSRAYQRLAQTMLRGLERARAAGSGPIIPYDPAWNLPVAPPRTQYARSRGHSVAFQVAGAGPVDLMFVPGWVSHLDVAWRSPLYARFLGRLATRTRLVLFDRVGAGLSDRVLDDLSHEARAADLLEVMTAAKTERATLIGVSDAASTCALLAAKHPERVRALILVGGCPSPFPAAVIDEACARIEARWGDPLFLDDEAPSAAHDPALREWWATYLRSASSPSGAAAMLRASAATDVRPLLGDIRVPTLVLHRKGDRMMPVDGGRAFAAAIPKARLVELDGEDHLPFTGDSDALLEAIARFLGDLPTET